MKIKVILLMMVLGIGSSLFAPMSRHNSEMAMQVLRQEFRDICNKPTSGFVIPASRVQAERRRIAEPLLEQIANIAPHIFPEYRRPLERLRADIDRWRGRDTIIPVGSRRLFDVE